MRITHAEYAELAECINIPAYSCSLRELIECNEFNKVTLRTQRSLREALNHLNLLVFSSPVTSRSLRICICRLLIHSLHPF